MKCQSKANAHPVEVVQFTGGNIKEVQDFLGCGVRAEGGILVLNAPNGQIVVQKHGLIIKEVDAKPQDHFTVLGPIAFWGMYEIMQTQMVMKSVLAI